MLWNSDVRSFVPLGAGRRTSRCGICLVLFPPVWYPHSPSTPQRRTEGGVDGNANQGDQILSKITMPLQTLQMNGA